MFGANFFGAPYFGQAYVETVVVPPTPPAAGEEPAQVPPERITYSSRFVFPDLDFIGRTDGRGILRLPLLIGTGTGTVRKAARGGSTPLPLEVALAGMGAGAVQARARGGGAAAINTLAGAALGYVQARVHAVRAVVAAAPAWYAAGRGIVETSVVNRRYMQEQQDELLLLFLD